MKKWADSAQVCGLTNRAGQQEADHFACAWSKDLETGDPLLCVSGVNAKIKIINVLTGECLRVRSSTWLSMTATDQSTDFGRPWRSECILLLLESLLSHPGSKRSGCLSCQSLYSSFGIRWLYCESLESWSSSWKAAMCCHPWRGWPQRDGVDSCKLSVSIWVSSNTKYSSLSTKMVDILYLVA